MAAESPRKSVPGGTAIERFCGAWVYPSTGFEKNLAATECLLQGEMKRRNIKLFLNYRTKTQREREDKAQNNCFVIIIWKILLRKLNGKWKPKKKYVKSSNRI